MQDSSTNTTPQGVLDITTFGKGKQLGQRTSVNFQGRTLSNSISTILGWLIPSAIFLFLTPFLVHGIGQEAYGIFTMTMVITGYMSLMNFGFGQAVTKHVAQYAAIDDTENLRLVVSAGVLIFPAIGAVGAIMIHLAAGWLARDVFNIVPEMYGDAVVAIQLSAQGFFLNMLTSFLEGLAIGVNRFDNPNVIRTLRVALSSALMVLGVMAGYGLIGMMVGNIVGQAISTIVAVIWTFRLVPQPRIQGATKKVRELFNFGKFIFVARAFNTTAGQVGPTALGMFSTMTSVTQYSLPTRVITTVMDMFQRLFDLIFPMSAALHSQNQKERLSQIFVSLMRWQLVLFTPIFILTLFQGRWLLRLWLGPEFVASGYTILLITVVYDILSTLTGIPSGYALGMGHPEYGARFTVIRLALILACIYPFVKLHGAIGVAEATLVSSLQGVVFIVFVSKRLLKLDLWHLFRPDLLKLAGLLGSFVILYVLLGDRIDSLNSIFTQVGVSLVLMALYFGVAVVIKVLPIEEAKRLLNREFWKKI
jgi:O-antigen/teichoic acid export membrane protein